MYYLYHIFETTLGWVGIIGTEGKISFLELPKSSYGAAEEALIDGTRLELKKTGQDFSGSSMQIVDYFAGKKLDFKCELDPIRAGDFDKRVWNAAREIEYGAIRTYGWIADRIGQPKAARAVGQALGRNPVPIIIPCHRVLQSQGGLGGFSSGIHWKIKLLRLEGSYIE